MGRDVGNGTCWGFERGIFEMIDPPVPGQVTFVGGLPQEEATRAALVPEDQGRPRCLASAQMESSPTNLVNFG